MTVRDADQLSDPTENGFRLRRQPRNPADLNRAFAAPATIRLMLLSAAATLAVILSQIAIIEFVELRGSEWRWILPACTAAIALIVLSASFLHAKRQEDDLRERHRILAHRMELLEDRWFQIEESEEIHRSILEAYGDPILHTDHSGEPIYTNQAFIDVFGARQSAVLSDELRQALPPEGPVVVGQARDVELSTPQGRRWFSWMTLAYRDDIKDLSGFRSVARDITERKLHEAAMADARATAEAHTNAKSRFIATISHEIRTPLNGILGLSDLLVDTPLTPAQKNHVQAIHKSGHALLDLVEDVLDLTKVEADKLELHPTQTNLREMCEDVLELLATRIDLQRVDLGLYLSADLPDHIVIDGPRLRQILLNLVGNAVKFTDDGAIILDVRQSPDNGLIVDIRDSGPGMTSDQQTRIFDEFQQLDSHSTKARGGTGLGLTITSRIIEAMNGSIDIKSEPGIGSTFTVNLPLQTGQPDSANTAIRLNGKAKVALLAPDNPAMWALARTIGDLGATVSIVDETDARTFLAEGQIQDLGLNQTRDHNAGTAIERIILIDDRLDTSADFELADRSIRRIALIPPGAPTPTMADTAYDGWLQTPVRHASLLKVLFNQQVAGGPAVETTAPDAHLQTEIIDPRDRSGVRVLLVDDNEINILLVSSQLDRLGIQCEVAENGVTALQRLQQPQNTPDFDLVLMDMHMPIMDGIETTARIRALEGAKAAVPIMMLSADDQEESRRTALEAGANGFLPKPVSIETLQDAIDQALDRRKSA